MAGTLSGVPNYELQPSSKKAALSTNYITDFDFMTQYLPDVYEQEFERYGNRTIAGFLRQLGAEIPSNSDLIKWTEQGRLHTKYTDVNADGEFEDNTAEFTVGDTGITECNFRVGQTVFLSANATALSAKAIITGVSGLTFEVAFYDADGQPFAVDANVTAFVYGSEFRKGTEGMVGSLEAEPVIFDVKPVIIKDHFAIAGSDMAQIGWVEVEGDNGMGYLWYLKSQHETRLRFEDYLEMMMVEHVQTEAGSGAASELGSASGTEGLFSAVSTRGNVWSGGIPDTMQDFDDILNRLDKQGSIAENTLFINRAFSLSIDDMLAAQNSYGVGGTSYGLFDNDKEMALNLGFTGFRRGSYDFYKTDWKYLNDATLRGGIVGGVVNGVMVPAGTMSVYDQVIGKNLKRPFLHVRYRQSETENRRYKTWITGSAGGAQTSSLDAMEVHFLSERALCTLGANNFFIFE